MIGVDCPVRLVDGGRPATPKTALDGYVREFRDFDGVHRWWLVDWDQGPASVTREDLLVDVEHLEWQEALRGVEDAERCPSVGAGSASGGRRCAMRAGHRTKRHRECEVSWL